MNLWVCYSFRAKYELKQNIEFHGQKSSCDTGTVCLFMLRLCQRKSFLNLGFTAKDENKWKHNIEIILCLTSLELKLYFGSVHRILSVEGGEKENILFDIILNRPDEQWKITLNVRAQEVYYIRVSIVFYLLYYSINCLLSFFLFV